MNPNSRQVYTCISSADKLCISHTVSIHIFFFFRNGGVRVRGARAGVFGYVFLVKFSLKPNPNRRLPSVHSFFSFFPKTEVKRNVQKFRVLTFTFPKDGCCFFTPQLFGCSPPPSPPVFSPPQKTRSPFRRFSSFLAWISSCR